MSSIDEYLGKQYKLKSSDNFDEYMKFIEVGMISRKLAASVSPTTALERNADGSYTITMTTSIRTVKITFKLGEEFEETRLDGSKVQSTMTTDGNKLIHLQVENNGRKSTHVREFSADQMIVTSTAEGWDGKCVRVYELVK